MEIRIELSKNLKAKPVDESALSFGKIFTDHMFLMAFDRENGWHDPRIVPYGPLELDPAATCLHYGQLVFEGMKAYRAGQKIVMFRPDQNMTRMNLSNDRLCIPPIDEAFMVKAITKLVEIEKDWVPKTPGTSLYIRPFILSTDAFLGVHAADTYLFAVILSPVGAYYKEGLAPIKIYVENNYVRAVKGGTGFTKSAGNYAASLKSQMDAEEQGFSQVLWLDGVHRKNVEEVGSMNVFFVIDGEAITPALEGSILDGVTRKTVVDILKDWNYPVSERTISIDEIADAYQAGKLQEAFGTGTAAVISPIGQLKYGDISMTINNNQIGALSQKLYDEISGIQTGKCPDTHKWLYTIL